jgi:hypothetical protein
MTVIDDRTFIVNGYGRRPFSRPSESGVLKYRRLESSQTGSNVACFQSRLRSLRSWRRQGWGESWVPRFVRSASVRPSDGAGISSRSHRYRLEKVIVEGNNARRGVKRHKSPRSDRRPPFVDLPTRGPRRSSLRGRVAIDAAHIGGVCVPCDSTA